MLELSVPTLHTTAVPAEEARWLAAHLYYAGPHNDFLVQSVKPFVKRVLSRGWARQFFFIRYRERGPHIRLRFKTASEAHKQKIKAALPVHFQQYFAQFPSQRQVPPDMHAWPAQEQWFPDHSVQWLPYEPETERYGGPAGLAVSETLFEASSRAVLTVLAQKSRWDYDRALGVALQMHLGYAHAMGMDLAEASRFFAAIFRQWLPQAYYHPGQPLTDRQRLEQQQAVLDAFATSYAGQSATILPFIGAVWEALDTGADFAQAWYRHWLRDVKSAGAQLEAAQREGLLQTGGWYQLPPDPPRPDRVALLLIGESHIHMTNNRLGLLNRDEGYVGYLLMKGIASLGGAANL